MALEVGEVFEGKVTGITKFGAFVAMPDGKNGLVHISEIANTYVNDINEFVKEGQVVKVRVIGIGDGGKVNLSMKQAEAQAQPRPARPRYNNRDNNNSREGRDNNVNQNGGDRPQRRPAAPNRNAAPRTGEVKTTSDNASFEDMMKQFMQESDSRIAGNKMYADHKTSRRRR
ncbi:MAG: S1 RNA-binding domain-containing protein [Oscillospiraceae bacterium]|nr:S1 RNA-binding domain-containing protein [Oscillospiraceae bacterium]